MRAIRVFILSILILNFGIATPAFAIKTNLLSLFFISANLFLQGDSYLIESTLSTFDQPICKNTDAWGAFSEATASYQNKYDSISKRTAMQNAFSMLEQSFQAQLLKKFGDPLRRPRDLMRRPPTERKCQNFDIHFKFPEDPNNPEEYAEEFGKNDLGAKFFGGGDKGGTPLYALVFHLAQTADHNFIPTLSLIDQATNTWIDGIPQIILDPETLNSGIAIDELRLQILRSPIPVLLVMHSVRPRDVDLQVLKTSGIALMRVKFKTPAFAAMAFPGNMALNPEASDLPINCLPDCICSTSSAPR